MQESLSLDAVSRIPARSRNDLIELPIFPLPNVVFFPNTLLPLHIFEPRYRLMVREALEQDSAIGIVLMKGQKESEESDIFEIGGMGKITEHRKLDGGKYDILLTGQRRFRIVDVERDSPYRIARVELLTDLLPDIRTCQNLSEELAKVFMTLIRVRKQELDPAILRQLDFPTLVNSVCSSVSLDDRGKQRLLETDDLHLRARTVLLIMEKLRDRYEILEEFDHLRPGDPRSN